MMAYQPEDYADLLQMLERTGLPHFLQGGQAVNLWALYFAKCVNGLLDYAPFTSKDCDLWISYPLFIAIQDREAPFPGVLIKSTSPVDGQLGIWRVSESPPKVIDLMLSVYGLSPQEVERASTRSLVINRIRILDPLYLFKGKCHNLVSLDQSLRQDLRHLHILRLVVPAYFVELIEAAKQGVITERALISNIKLVLGFAKDNAVRQALSQLGLSLSDLLPNDHLETCGLAKVERFVFIQLRH